MNGFSITSIAIIVTNTVMTYLLMTAGKKSKAYIIFGYLCILALSWGISGYFISVTQDKNTSYYWWQMGYITVVYAPVVFAHFTFKFLNINRKTFISLCYGLASVYYFIVLFKKDWMFVDLRYIFNEYYNPDPLSNNNFIWLSLYILFWWVLLLSAFYCLYTAYRKASGNYKNQLKYILVATSIGWLGGHLYLILYLHIDIYPWGNILVAIFPIIMGYAIIRHQLMDIRIIVQKSLVYSLTLTSLSIVYLLSVFLFENLISLIFGHHSKLVSFLTIFILGISFLPLRNKFQRYTEILFLKGSPIKIAEENEYLRKEVAQKEKFKAIATLASGIAHEIKNPITALQTFIGHFPKKKDDPKFIEKFESISKNEIARINNLVKQLLVFAKPSPLEIKHCNINTIITDTLDLLSNDIKKHNINLLCSLTTDNPTIIGDKNQLKQVFLNIIMNAIEAMADGGELSIRTDIKGKPKQVSIFISDTGLGINKSDLPHIFEPFYSKKAGGTGLGLAITKGIIENHKGKINVAIYNGSKFTISFTNKEGDYRPC